MVERKFVAGAANQASFTSVVGQQATLIRVPERARRLPSPMRSVKCSRDSKNLT